MSIAEQDAIEQVLETETSPVVDKTVELIARSVECRLRNADPAEVRLRVKLKLRQFEHARVKTYIPILVERAVVRDLLEATP